MYAGPHTNPSIIAIIAVGSNKAHSLHISMAFMRIYMIIYFEHKIVIGRPLSKNRPDFHYEAVC